MNKIKIDAVGVLCPKPVIMTKKELDSVEAGTVQLIADNEICVENLRKYAQSQGFKYEVEQTAEDRWLVEIEKLAGTAVEEEDKSGTFALGIGSRYYGQGDEKLGEILMNSFIYTVKETQPLPQVIVFFNAGVFLTTQDSNILEDLKDMEEAGVEIVSCGTCLDFYGLKDDLKVGSFSNMYTIYEHLKGAERNMIIG